MTVSEKLNKFIELYSDLKWLYFFFSSDINADSLFRTENRRKDARISKSDGRNRGSWVDRSFGTLPGDFQFTFVFSLGQCPFANNASLVAFSLPPCSTFADHARSFNLRPRQETPARIFEDAEPMRARRRQEDPRRRGYLLPLAEKLSAVVSIRPAPRWKRSLVRNYWRPFARVPRNDRTT